MIVYIWQGQRHKRLEPRRISVNEIPGRDIYELVAGALGRSFLNETDPLLWLSKNGIKKIVREENYDSSIETEL